MTDYGEVQKWYAEKCNKTAEELDDYDNWLCKVAYDYASEKEQLLLSRAYQMEKEEMYKIEKNLTLQTEVLVGIQRIVKLIERHIDA